MCVLLLYNTRDRLSYDEIQQETEIPEKDLIRALQSLSMGKAGQRLLLRTPKSKDIEPTNEFVVNDAFVSKFHRYERVNGRFVVIGFNIFFIFFTELKFKRWLQKENQNQNVKRPEVKLMKIVNMKLKRLLFVL